jgi:hypothetical protein
MLILQVPAPPAPPPLPDPVFVQTFPPSGPPEELFIAIAVMTVTIVAGVLLYPLIRAFARRLEGGAGGGAGVAQLEGRIAELEHRLAEAEDRLDFNERLLAQREAIPLPRDKAD